MMQQHIDSSVIDAVTRVEECHQFYFDTIPIAKARPRAGKFGFYTPKKTKDFETILKQQALEQWDAPPLDCPLMVDVVFKFARPKSVTRTFMSVRPDLDNFIKSVFDSLNGTIWKDDGQIVYLTASKVYDDKSGIELNVFKFSEE